MIVGASVAAGRINPDPAQWTGLVDAALVRWRGRVSEVCLEELQQVGLTRLYLEAQKWNGRGSFPQYVMPRIQWAMLDWLRVEGLFTRGKNGRAMRIEQGKRESWRDHPEMPPHIPVTLVFCRFGHPAGLGVMSQRAAADLIAEGGEVLTDDIVAESAPSPEDEFAVNEDLRMLDGLINGLESAMARRVIRLRLDGQPLKKVAHTVGLSPSRVQQIYREAIASMQCTAKRQGLERNV